MSLDFRYAQLSCESLDVRDVVDADYAGTDQSK
jgi:hypothetical protein